ncbi:hypothetical protein [Eubacterium coprostanoligenes]|uniref:hypothetical protein n=1 Tax=Eubacterium coprostanoligenes TaxID=290054 RepID=UPI002357ABE4|nr:hypothetical protein [Eubacterium coprostanoligenes]MCI6354424.1 hypothetical protein [Eubacterium coprostanoligenes]
MKKRFSIILLLLTLCCVTIFFVGCDDSSANNNVKDSNENYYNIDLTMDNHWKFLDWDKRNNQFTGVLSYAYYDNVVITLQRKIISEYTTNTYSENYTIELNTAGCKTYSFTEYTFDQIKELLNHTGYLGSYGNEITIISISGKVQFSI